MPLRLVLVLALLVLPVPARAAPWVLDPATAVAVDVEWEGQTVEVRFPTISGEVDFDRDRPGSARAAIEVATGDATAGLAPVDALVRSPGYLWAERYPSLTFRLDRLDQTSQQTAEIVGRITLRGVTRPVAFHAEVFRYGPAEDDPGRFEAGFNLSGSIDRTEFGSTAGVPEVAAVLPVRIRLLMRSR
jgi:polyisoprenoid-binding protein YceI